MVKEKDLRSFYILSVYPTITNNSLLIQKLREQLQKPIKVNGDTVYIKIKDLENDLLEMELLWETLEEVNSERLSENGQIVTEKGVISNVSSLQIWVYSGSSFIFVFGKGFLYKKVIKLFQIIFEGYDVEDITLRDNFFRKLIEYNNISRVTQLTYESSMNNQEFMVSVSGHGIEKSQLWPSAIQGHIKEIKLEMNGNTLKINQRGRVSLFNSPYVEDVRRITEYLNSILMYSYDGGNYRE